MASRSSKRKTLNGAVFVDLDGTIWPDLGPGTILKISSLNDDLIQAFGELSQLGYSIIGFSNQTFFGYKETLNLFQILKYRYRINRLIKNKILDAVFICHHHPESKISFLRRDCTYRKPNSGLLIWASKELSVNLNDSFAVGDRITDVLSALRAGIRRRFLIIGATCLEFNKPNESSSELSIEFEISKDLKEAIARIREEILSGT